MAGPTDRPLPVLLLDPGGEISDVVGNILSEPNKSRWSNFDIQRVETHEEVIKSLSGNVSVPQYGAVIYRSDMLEGKMRFLGRARRRDPYMPLVIVNGKNRHHSSLLPEWLSWLPGIGKPYNPLDSTILEQAANVSSGNLWHIENPYGRPEMFLDAAWKMFRITKKVPRSTVIKMGGSSFDEMRNNKLTREMQAYCTFALYQHLLKISSKKKGEPILRANRLLFHVGAGQHGDVVKDYFAKHKEVSEIGGRILSICQEHPYYQSLDSAAQDSLFLRLMTASQTTDVARQYPQLIVGALESNLKMLQGILGIDNAMLLEPGKFHYLAKSSFGRKIPLVGLAPHYRSVLDEIPWADSDTHTIALADHIGAETVILLKDTDGIYLYDPNRGLVLDGQGKCTDYQALLTAQADNRRLSEVPASKILSEISREGTDREGEADGSPGHLVEDTGVQRFLESSVKRMVILPISPEKFYVPVGGGVLRHVVTGAHAPVGIDWYQERFDLLDRALRGDYRGLSVITKE